mmetsp:Transcript_189/g.705  ORF Transcript_189/g.705 Transcript_189/m.705 type:complete len:230 (+) Transcript_189:557-1246(+)
MKRGASSVSTATNASTASTEKFARFSTSRRTASTAALAAASATACLAPPVEAQGLEKGSVVPMASTNLLSTGAFAATTSAGRGAARASQAADLAKTSTRVDNELKGESAATHAAAPPFGPPKEWRWAPAKIAATAPMDLPKRPMAVALFDAMRWSATDAASADSLRPKVQNSPSERPDPAASKAQTRIPKAKRGATWGSASILQEALPWQYKTQGLFAGSPSTRHQSEH